MAAIGPCFDHLSELVMARYVRDALVQEGGSRVGGQVVRGIPSTELERR